MLLILGDRGDDIITVTADVADALISGSSGDDQIFYSGPGTSTILGFDGDDFIMGGSGVDIIRGDAGEDTIFGGDGDDELFGGTDGDLIYGENGNDFIEVSLGAFLLG